MPSLSWNRKRAAHLYRRAGFGALPEELDRAVAMGREAAVDYLLDFETIPTTDLDAFLAKFGFDFDTYYDDGTLRRVQKENLVFWWLLRMAHTPRPLEEKLALFWHGHFATSFVKSELAQYMLTQYEIFRTMGMGKFGDLLLAVSRDPAMIAWLDNATNTKSAPNENFAREVMELFTMGIGHYTQKDVTEAARAFTGWTLDYGASPVAPFLFDASVHDDGVKVFLGNEGGFFGEDICAILAARPETAAFVSAKLVRFFLGRDARPEMAKRLQDIYVESDGEIRKIVREILLSEDFDESADRADAFKSPSELIAGSMRVLGAPNLPPPWGTPDDLGFLGGAWPINYAVEDEGQPLFEPANVAGWKGGKSWIDTGLYLLRTSHLLMIASNADIERLFAGSEFRDPEHLIDFLVDRLNMIDPSPTVRQALRDYLAGSGIHFAWTPEVADRWGRGAIHLLMASPDYQLE